MTDMLRSIYGLIRWTIDLISFLTDELLELSGILKGRFDHIQLVNETSTFITLSICLIE